jgi:hypothetical protein
LPGVGGPSAGAQSASPAAAMAQLSSSASQGDVSVERMGPALGAMPVPRFPSMPSMTDEARSNDFNEEARRLAKAARRAADFAEAAAQCARLAAEAALAAADGERHQAIIRLRDAQNIEDKIIRGELPSRASIDLTATMGDAQHLHKIGNLARREVLTVAIIVAIGVLLAILLVVTMM